VFEAYATIPVPYEAEVRDAHDRALITFSAAGLDGVGAASRTDAWAVGDKYTRGERTLILRWNARTRAWVKVPSPNPARGGGGRSAPGSLNGVAVLTQTDAWAVGAARSRPSHQWNTLIEHWDGSRWTVIRSPDPPVRGASARRTAGRGRRARGDVGGGATTAAQPSCCG
jgi:hypothetical protein